MTCHAIRVAVLLAVPPLAGCGTVANLAGAGPGKKVPFGGVHRDAQCLQDVRADDPAAGEPNHYRQVAKALCVVDLPLSLVGDLVTWPYTRAYTYINQPSDYPALAVVGPVGGPPPAGVPTPPPPGTTGVPLTPRGGGMLPPAAPSPAYPPVFGPTPGMPTIPTAPPVVPAPPPPANPPGAAGATLLPAAGTAAGASPGPLRRWPGGEGR